MVLNVASGQCMCGAITYSVEGPLRDVWNCHCHRCRRFTGHYLAATRAPQSAITIVDEHGALRWYEPHPTARYGFCSTCGSSMFWFAAARPDALTIAAGSLDQPTGLSTTTAWWMGEHADYHDPQVSLIEHDGDG
jgi:hypothetical protein